MSQECDIERTGHMDWFSWENEWRIQVLKEKNFLRKHTMEKTAGWVSHVEHKVPDTLQKTLEAAFNKAFVAVFQKGGVLIEKTYNKEKQEILYKENQRLLEQETMNAKSVKKFEKQAKRTIRKNLALTSVEGVGLGLAGIGVPDIPIFVSVLLKSIYEIAISYGFSYTEEKEKLFILKIMETALKSGEILQKKDNEVNHLIERYYKEETEDEIEKTDEFVTELQIIRQIDSSAKALSKELLYGKFVQGMLVVGVVGGTADVTCLKRVTDYAVLKYKRRFLLRQKPDTKEKNISK